MIFMMTLSNDDKSDNCQFFYQDLFHIVHTVYVQNFMQNTKIFSACFFTTGLLAPPHPPTPRPEILKKTQPK